MGSGAIAIVDYGAGNLRSIVHAVAHTGLDAIVTDEGPFSATPVAAGGFLYCVNEKGLVQVVDPSQPEGAVVSEMDLGQTIIGTPSIAQGSLFLRSDGMLWRIGRPRSSAL